MGISKPIAASRLTQLRRIPASSVIAIHYRVRGCLCWHGPLASGNPINFLDLTQTAQITDFSVNVVGSSAANDPMTVGAGRRTACGRVGISDVEPFVGYELSFGFPAVQHRVYGTIGVDLLLLGDVPLFQQAFGIFVNTAG